MEETEERSAQTLTVRQEENYAFFSSHLYEYLSDPTKRYKYAVICDKSLRGLFDTFEGALEDACGHYRMGEFIIQQIIDPTEVVSFVWAGVS